MSWFRTCALKRKKGLCSLANQVVLRSLRLHAHRWLKKGSAHFKIQMLHWCLLGREDQVLVTVLQLQCIWYSVFQVQTLFFEVRGNKEDVASFFFFLLVLCNVLSHYKVKSPAISVRRGFIECSMITRKLYLHFLLLCPDMILIGIGMSVTY